ncbi:MAG TPA: S41 family peptidase [Thermoanaerobaculia bacterium]
MKILRALSPLAALMVVAGIAPAEESRPGFAALGREVVARVRDEFLDAERAARWAEENAGYADRITDAEAFRRETRRRLADLRTSHTAYYTPDDPGYYELLSIFEPVLKKPAETESLGLAAVELEDGWFVARVFAGGPAEAAGVRRGDRIVAADGQPFHPRRSLAGKAGKTVALEVRSRKDGPARTVSIIPRRVDPKQEWLDAQRAGTRVLEVQGRRVGYAPLWSCAGAQFQEALEESLQGDLAQADTLVVDLRGGWGGCNPTFVNLFNPMVPEMERIDRKGERSTFSASWRKPLVLLVDGGSRSGKEMVARALQRRGRAVLVGERTVGAVVAGKPILLSDGSLLYLAVEDVRVDGERLEGVGVTPDVVVPAELPYAEGRDAQLERAVLPNLKQLPPARDSGVRNGLRRR